MASLFLRIAHLIAPSYRNSEAAGKREYGYRVQPQIRVVGSEALCTIEGRTVGTSRFETNLVNKGATT